MTTLVEEFVPTRGKQRRKLNRIAQCCITHFVFRKVNQGLSSLCKINGKVHYANDVAAPNTTPSRCMHTYGERYRIFIPQDAAVIWHATVNLRLTDRYIPVHTLLVWEVDKARYANLDRVVTKKTRRKKVSI